MSSNINVGGNNAANNDQGSRNAGIRRAVQRIRQDNPDQDFNLREFRQNVRSEVMPFHRAVKLKQNMNHYNQYVQEKKAFNAKVARYEGNTKKAGEALGLAISFEKVIASGDGIEIASSIVGIISFGAAFFPPVGTAVAALGGIVTTILGLFGSAPSDVDILSGLIKKQTEHIENLIEEQTEILLEAIEKLGEQQVKLAEGVVKELFTENYRQMIDYIHGVNTALKMKMEHINKYKETCVESWTDISTETDMQEVNLQFGRIGSYMQRYCASRPNMMYCGELLYQYVLMASLRDMVRIVAKIARLFNKSFYICLYR